MAKGFDRWRAARWIAAGFILVCLAVGLLTDSLKTCETTSQRGSTKSTCRTPQLTDAGAIVFGLIIVGLVLPDFNEVGVLGITAKRRIEQVEEQARESRERVQQLEGLLNLQQVRVESIVNQHTMASASTTVGLFVGGEALAKAVEEIPRKREQYRSVANPAGSPEVAPDVAGPGDLTMQLLADWGGIETSRAALSPESRRRFESIFAEELAIVEAVKNSIFQDQPISAKEIEQAQTIASELKRVLQDGE